MSMANIAICDNCGGRSQEYISVAGASPVELQGWFQTGTNDSSKVNGLLCSDCVDVLREALIDRKVASDA